MSTLSERVAAGAALLDEKRPGWEMEIDCARLNIASRRDCMCGQLYGEYATGVVKLGVEPAEYGFLTLKLQPETFEELTEGWRETIAARRQVHERVLELVH
jgi:hypothetical protein